MSVGNVGSSPSVFPKQEGKLEPQNNEYQAEQKEHHKHQDVVLSKQDLQEKVESMNDFLLPTQTSLKFELHEKLDRYYVQVIDDKTKEVIREIPNKKFLDMYAAMAELVGIVVDEKI
ncbi:flagellar protein FlaG [Pseudalkalibacillus salsuginis]|uniref:flagellar protein FlaG n=1 Tax=Pseudalkalibacillus salsuginis TaxID=2910972 RepID=UPI001F3BAC10|nr:flagellar protein FlaG [Pseudalkalibacillus salsuginis]MCF6410154.1 flagellar protein FlaG [Pseudalkalibacillus salsuginis]